MIQHSYSFGDFTVDLDQKVLLRENRPVALTPKLFDTLVILIENSGRIVEKEVLMSRLWPDTFVEEANLTSNVQQLRKILGDNARNPTFIETISKRGYRFIAAVTGPSDESPTAKKAASSVSLSEGNSVEEGRKQNSFARSSALRSYKAVFLGIAALFIAVFGLILLRSRLHARPQPPGERTMLAVLPFKNLTGDPTQEYFSDGLTEEMISHLGNLDSSHLGVIARTSVMHYKTTDESLEQVARELSVQYVLEGSVRRDSNKVRITAQLIKTADQTHVWAREYDRELGSLLVVQDEISQAVANEIRITLTDNPPGTASPLISTAPSYETYDLFLKGQYLWNKRTSESLREAIEYFLQATTKDPNYARAYAALANSYVLMGGYSGQPQTEFISKARSAALRALELDKNLPEAHTALALILQNYDWDWEGSEKEFRRAIELNPNYATAHHWYAEHLALLGRFDEALRESERARQLDPLSLIIATDNGAILYFSRQYDRAIRQFRAVEEMDPNFPRAQIVIFAYVEKGMFAEAEADLERWRRTDDTPWTLAESAYVLGRSGHQSEARLELKKLEKLNSRSPLDPEVILFADLGVGNTDEAFTLLEKAYAQHSNVLTTLNVDPVFDPLRRDPRFKDLMHRIHMA